MNLPGARASSQDFRDPLLHELEPLRADGRSVSVTLAVRIAEDGAWRGRLLFDDSDGGPTRTTAEIFCGGSEEDLWQSVRGLREHHVRDLYRSLG